MKTTGWVKNLRVYCRYYYGRLRGWDMRLWGRPGTARFKAIRLSPVGPPLGPFVIHGASQSVLDELERLEAEE